jgi:hypothetical protein
VQDGGAWIIGLILRNKNIEPAHGSDYVGIGNDVTIRIDDHARAAAGARTEGRSIVLRGRHEAGCDYLHDSRLDSLNECLKLAAQRAEIVRLLALSGLAISDTAACRGCKDANSGNNHTLRIAGPPAGRADIDRWLLAAGVFIQLLH